MCNMTYMKCELGLTSEYGGRPTGTAFNCRACWSTIHVSAHPHLWALQSVSQRLAPASLGTAGCAIPLSTAGAVVCQGVRLEGCLHSPMARHSLPIAERLDTTDLNCLRPGAAAEELHRGIRALCAERLRGGGPQALLSVRAGRRGPRKK